MRRYPIPEAIDGSREWSVAESGSGVPRCAIGERALFVPLGGVCKRCGEDHARVIRLHEMTHAAISPRDPAALRVEGVQPMTLLAVEDRRIERRMEREGWSGARSLHMCREDLLATARVRAHEGLREATLYAVCAPDTRSAETIEEAIREEDPALWGKVGAMVRGVDDILFGEEDPPGWDRTVAAAEWLERILGLREDAEEAKEDGEDGEPGEDPLRLLGREAFTEGREGEPVYMPMTVEEPGRPVSVEAARNVARWRTVESGSILRRPDRLLSDRRIFGRRLRHAGGCILVDSSGSMAAVSPAVLEEACKAAPAATVARYAGAHDHGTLRVVMRDGKRVPDDVLFEGLGGANGCDGLALRWLARQPGPRVWVSDGGVSEGYADGGGERFTERAVVDCARVCVDAGIVRVLTLEDAVKVLDGRARRGKGR